MANLDALLGPLQGKSYRLDKETTLLGRDSKCDIVIKVDAVSRTHATISRIQGTYYIADGDGCGVRSLSGLLRNNVAVPFPGRVLLADGDLLKICDSVFRFGVERPVDDEDTSVIDASVSHLSSKQILETQPAEKLKVILGISNTLSKTLDLDRLLPRMVESLFELFKQANRGFLILVDEPSGELITKIRKTRKPQDKLDARWSSSIVRQCLAKVEALLSNEPGEQFPTESVVTSSIRSVMCAPLWSQDGQALGCILLDTHHSGAKFTEEDLNLLLGVASQASIALVNARLYQHSLLLERLHRELELARLLQSAFLPPGLPDVAGYEFFAFCQPASEVGGDCYDFIPLSDGRLGLLVGDVAGKGVSAALVMARFSTAARMCLMAEADLAVAIGKLNVLMGQVGLVGRFVTLVAAVLDPRTHTVTLVNAGHPLPLLLHQTTGTWAPATPLEMSGTPIGILEGCDYSACQVALQPGDTLVFFSDGVTDAVDVHGRRFGNPGLAAVLGQGIAGPRSMGERIVAAVRQHAALCQQQDDITILCCGREREGPL
jgi:serine phosphatase RsbU (regulator of sigma subunit)/pSer/pThr/pTyr-binding forkhead associated (FHA) protein